jgi:hypothetical protein
MLSSPDSNECLEYGADYWGYDIANFAVDTIHECQAACFTHRDCFHWTLDLPGGRCFLKNKDARNGRRMNGRTVSGIKNCGMLFVYKEKAAYYYGHLHFLLYYA